LSKKRVLHCIPRVVQDASRVKTVERLSVVVILGEYRTQLYSELASREEVEVVNITDEELASLRDVKGEIQL
jgi:hypothetical protein